MRRIRSGTRLSVRIATARTTRALSYRLANRRPARAWITATYRSTYPATLEPPISCLFDPSIGSDLQTSGRRPGARTIRGTTARALLRARWRTWRLSHHHARSCPASMNWGLCRSFVRSKRPAAPHCLIRPATPSAAMGLFPSVDGALHRHCVSSIAGVLQRWLPRLIVAALLRWDQRSARRRYRPAGRSTVVPHFLISTARTVRSTGIASCPSDVDRSVPWWTRRLSHRRARWFPAPVVWGLCRSARPFSSSGLPPGSSAVGPSLVRANARAHPASTQPSTELARDHSFHTVHVPSHGTCPHT
jgi:hypothetical protein